MTCDVLVVGAGPAGAAAAIELARAGRDVLVIDKASFPRDKCCGDGLTTLALRELEHLGFEPSAVADWFSVNGAWLRSPGGAEFEVPLPRGGIYAATAPRRQFDDALVSLVRRNGVTVLDAHALDGNVEVLSDEVRVDVDRIGTVRARYVVAADGMWSPMRKALGANLDQYRGDWHAFRQYAGNVSGPASERLYVWFEPDLLPGYAWSFPLPGNRANIGFGVLRDGKRRVRDMSGIWTDLLQRPHVVAALGSGYELEGRHTAWPIPARVDEISLTHGRVMFVGDAAAATDVMTGEGIGQALLTGRLAAEAIVDAGALDADLAMRHYERSVDHHLFADHRMSVRLGKVLASRRGTEAALRIVQRSGAWGKANFARWMFEDEPRAVALTPSRWHRAFLGRPGAYSSTGS